jgi:hypothetical protein
MTTRTPRRLHATTIALALIALGAGAGCGSDATEPTTAGGGGSGGTGGTATTQAKAVRFAECMRTHGVRGFPDPDASGELTIDAVANEAKVDVSSAAFARAGRTCKDLRPSGFTGTKRTPEQQSATLRFAACIRAHGVKDFPDPAEGQAPVDTRRIPSANRPGGMDALNAAMRACGSALNLEKAGAR